jgi:hypothetical protein
MYTVINSQGSNDYSGDGNHQIVGSTNITGTLHQLSGSVAVSNLPYAVNVITASSNLTLSSPGAYVLSSSTGAVTVTVPDPGRIPAGTYIFRCGSAHAHLITGSVAGFQSFIPSPGITTTGVAGSRIALPAVQNSSVTFTSDGFHHVIHAASGTCTLAQS